MKYFITGGAGFIGSHLAEELIRNKHEVIVLDDLSTGRYENIAHFASHPGFEFVAGSVLDEYLVDKFGERADCFFHLAAAVGVELVIKNPLESLSTNIRGSEVVLNIAHRYHKKVLVVSSSEIYGKNTNVPLKEEDDRLLGSPLKSRWGYSTSKAVDELLAYNYYKCKGLPTIIVRLFNTVGPRQSGAYGMVIPRFVKQALAGEPLTVYGTGKQSRCFIHVRDAVDAMIGLMNHPQALGEVFNVGSQEEITIEDLAKKIIEFTQSSSKIVYLPYNKVYEQGFEDMMRRLPDINKIRKLIGFLPSMNLDEIVQDVIQYMKIQK